MKCKSSLMIVLSLMLVGLSFTSANRAAQLDSIPYLRTQHRLILDQWLKTKPTLRLATENDCVNREGLAATRQENGQNYQPYYAVGDFNRDQKEDFAVALIDNRRGSPKFAIAVFNGPIAGGRATIPNFFATGIDLSTGGLVLLSGNRLVAGVFQSDDCVVLRPRGRSYAMKACL